MYSAAITKCFLTTLCSLLLLHSSSAQTPGNITTIGGGAADGDLAIHTNLAVPRGIFVDTSGNVYLADTNQHRIRRIATDGTMTTIAGTGSGGYSGDGGQATEAKLSSPTSVFVDAAGVVYIADANNHRVRAIATDGLITTVAGDGFDDGFGLGRFTGDLGPATIASLARPWDISVDAGGILYIADRENQRIRRVAVDGTISTFAGNGTLVPLGDGGQAIDAGFVFPSSVIVSNAGVVYIAETSGNRIRRVATNGVITTVAGTGVGGNTGDGGPATLATLLSPLAIYLDGADNLFIADAGNDRIRKVDASGVISTFAGTGSVGFSGDGGAATDAQLDAPSGIWGASDGTIYFADSSNNRLRKVDLSGVISSVAGNGNTLFAGDGGPATTARLNSPAAVALASDGTVYIADSENHRVRSIDPAGNISTVAGDGVADFSGDGGPALSASFRLSADVALTPTGEIVVADTRNNRVRKISSAGVMSTIAGDGFVDAFGDGRFRGDNGPASEASIRGPRGIFVAANGNIFIADTENQRIRKIDADGVISTVAGDGGAGTAGDSGPATLANLNFPSGVHVDGIGNIYIADTANHLVRKVSPAGMISTVAGDGFLDDFSGGRFAGDGGPATLASLDFPTDIAVDNEGTIYIADTFSHRIRKVAVDGTISTIVGDGFIDGSGGGRFSGDDGTAIAASLNFPRGITLDLNRNIYIADTSNSRIRLIGGLGPVTAPTINVTSFTVIENLGVISVAWEIDRVSSQHGFNIVRASDPLGPFEVINSAPITGTEVSFSYLDRSGLTAGGQFYYDLEVIDISGSTSRNGAVNVQVSAVTTSELFQNAPNPFNPTTLIRFAIPVPTRVSIHVYNMLGQEVSVLLDNILKPAGFDVVTWDGTNATGKRVSSGVYLYRITTAAGFDQTKRMVLLR